MAVEKKPIRPDYSKRVMSVDEVEASQVMFDVVVEQVVDSVMIDRDGYGVTPVVAAFGIIAGHVEGHPPLKGKSNELTYRFNFDGTIYEIDVKVS